MKQGIIIVTSKQTEPFYNDLLFSLKDYTKYPVYIHRNTFENNHYEMSGIYLGMKLGLEEFFLLPDTCEIKNTDIFFKSFNIYEGYSVSIGALLPYIKGYVSYVGKYRLDVLKQIEIPQCNSKSDAIKIEREFHELYLKKEQNYIELFPDFWLQERRYEEKHNRHNLINENEFIKKYKATYDVRMCKEIL